MDNHYTVRRQYGGTYASVIDNEIIPWKLLSLKDYIQYQADISRGLYPLASIEDEIFCKCVLDKILVNQIDHLKAGIITLVAQHIWQYSGPIGVDSLNNKLNLARDEYHNGPFSIIHQLTRIITLAFPYKPEEIYEMDYETFVERLIQAEDKLLQAGLIKESIVIESSDIEVQKQLEEQQAKEKTKLNLKKIFDEEIEKKQKAKEAKKNATPDKKGKWYDKSPVLETKPTHGINFKLEQKEIDVFGTSGHEKTDLHINRDKMIKDAQLIYKDLLAELALKQKKE